MTPTGGDPDGSARNARGVANVFCFLASDEASFVTGSLYEVDGGITIGKGPIGLKASKHVKTQPESRLPTRHSHDGLKNKDYETVT